MLNVVIVGSSGHAKVIIDIIEKEQKYHIVGLIDSYKNIGEIVSGYKIIGKEEDIPELIKGLNIHGGIVGIGDNWTRSNVVSKIMEIYPNFNFVKAIHPSARIAKGVDIGKGTAIMANCVINSYSKIGDFCIVNSNSSLDHDSIMDHFSSLAPGVVTGGDVRIGGYSAICLGAMIIHGVTIGKHSVIGAGSTVLKNIPDLVISYGSPSKIIGIREKQQKYL